MSKFTTISPPKIDKARFTKTYLWGKILYNPLSLLLTLNEMSNFNPKNYNIILLRNFLAGIFTP